MAFTYDGGDGRLGIKALDGLTDVVAYDADVYANFKAFSPDGRWMIGTSRGVLSMYNGTTGEYLWDIPMDSTATHPDWSPDGERVTVVLTDGEEHWADWYFGGGRIAVMDHLGDGLFGEPRIVHEREAGSNAYYPAWSPDSEWLAFNVSTGDGYDDEDAAVWVVHRSGNGALPLLAANQTDGLTNSWPRWAPLPDDDVLWLAFGSKRPYGTIVDGAPQIWVAGFDPERALAGEDPSWPAFWLPNQDTAQSNHIPVWAE
jgi:Tol biopolymer transport system component